MNAKEEMMAYACDGYYVFDDPQPTMVKADSYILQDGYWHIFDKNDKLVKKVEDNDKNRHRIFQ